LAAIGAQVLFVGGFFVIGALEGHGYSVGRHDISDLAALTAHHAAAMLVIQGVAGALTAAFAFGALRPLLATGGAGPSVGALLVGASLPSLDSLSDAFFRLDCRAADAGCSMSDASASWHGKVHVAVFLVAAVATLVATFLLARRMKRVDGWRDLARPSRVVGVVYIVGMVAVIALTHTAAQGWSQRVLAALVCAGVVPLALRALRLGRPATRATS
jgi:hypothetical protein